jgi:hypothetical protein
MKLKEYKNTELFINTIFNFFKEKNLTWGLGNITDSDKLKNILLDSEFLSYNCSPSIEHYSIEFKTNKPVPERFVDYMLFGKEENSRDTIFLIDITEKRDNDFSFFSLSWYEGKYPPFMKDFIDEKGMIRADGPDGTAQTKVNHNEIMTFDKFEEFLKRNHFEKKLKMIEVD